MVLQIFGRRASEGDGRLNEVRVSAVAAGKAIAAIEGLRSKKFTELRRKRRIPKISRNEHSSESAVSKVNLRPRFSRLYRTA
jgi:hypothetical protein